MSPKPALNIEGWQTVHTIELPARNKELFGLEGLSLQASTRNYLNNALPEGLYRHQKEALQLFQPEKNICITTGTASGKSAIFYSSAIEKLAKSQSAKILAIYPTKALAAEQEDRWKSAFRNAGLSSEVGRIDGDVAMSSRVAVLRRASILIMTPDIIHAWLLSNLSEKSVVSFLRNLSLIVVDEVHEYNGVFGSNAGFLFRRMQHIMALLRVSAEYICASATIADPASHLRKLFGVDFELIGPELDTSPKFGVTVQLMSPSNPGEQLTTIAQLLSYLSTETPTRFVAFVDSRKQTEQLSAILARTQEKEEDEQESFFRMDHLEKLNVLPFRSGYEGADRKVIQDRLSRKALKGIISTSALELGMDIPSLEAAVLIGVPRSATSLFQRIGRIGRQGPGIVLVLNTGTVYDEAVFKEPTKFSDRPLAEGALYLENSRIQYIHALCLARNGGEHDQVASAARHEEETEFGSTVNWPDGFIDLCQRERRGEVSTDLQSMKSESGDDPNHVFPLRDVESSFKVEFKKGPEQRRLGTLNYGQLMREAYPGAVYYYTAKPYRIYKVNVHTKIAQARNEKGYTSKAQKLPTLVFPNLTIGNVFRSIKCEELTAVECNLQVRESICGYKERRGPNELTYGYPIATDGIYFNQPRFTRNYFTTGVVITHPALSGPKVNCDLLAELFFEGFLMTIPFERRDIAVAVDKHRVTRSPIHEGERFIALYDQTYGSLRLSGRILEGNVIKKVLDQTMTLLDNQEVEGIAPDALIALREIVTCFENEPSEFLFTGETPEETPASFVEIILPGSRGVNVRRNNEEFEVEDVFFSPQISGLAYRGRYLSTTGDSVKDIVAIDSLAQVPGESRIGQYNLNTGEIEEFKML